jgi:hypothetical protein
MNTNSILLRASAWSVLGLAAGLSGCSDGGSSDDGGDAGGFSLASSNVLPEQVWPLNRAMLFRFSQPVDAGSLNLNTISIVREGGAPSSGTFSLVDQRTVRFQPTCPTEDDFSDAGLVPGGLRYIVNVVGSSDGGATVRSTSGTPLTLGLTAAILTPDSSELSVLFEDPLPGPPTPRIWSGAGDPAGTTYLDVGGDPELREYFEPRTPPDLAFGAKLRDDFRSPLNLYSVTTSSVAFMVEIDQPVDPSEANVSPENVRLQYCSDPMGACGGSTGSWIDLPTDVDLVSNCTEGGATLRVAPIGILPRGRIVRCLLGTNFRDLVGAGNLIDLVVGSFQVDPGTDGGGMALPVADEFLEPFSVPGTSSDSSRDLDALLDAPPAVWGVDGKLEAGFNFGGTGGPGGDFDWTIEPVSGNGSVILNTTFAIITNADQTATQTVINGEVDVRNLHVRPGAILEIKGPRPCVIRASGDVRIEGKILIKGSNNRGVVTFNTTNIPESGAAGNGGGGRGGTGNILTTQSTPAGEAGYGAFDAPNGGGGGGETGFNPSASIALRRGAGGGGGSLGPPVVLNLATNVNQCPDQTIIGLDSEDGSPGDVSASGAISGPGQRPRGGLKGPRPFADADAINDFWGIMRLGPTVVRGELGQPWAGAGGGGGGNCVQSSSFPNTQWNPAGDEKGAGGGGGGGSLTILALGDIIFGANGRIDAGGGTGGGGENTSGINRVGAGSGAGSGGHVILQTAKRIDFRLTRTNQTPTSPPNNRGGIWARGAQGGEGENGAGGTGPDSIETGPTADRLPQDHYTVAQGGLVDPAPCAAAATGNTANYNIDGVGGDGGPGIIQLHVQQLSDILVPTTSGENLYKAIIPRPVGSTLTATVNNVSTPALWNQLLPIFGRISKAQSKWIPLGSTSVSPTASAPQPVAFDFRGLTAGGLVQTSAGEVGDLPSILTTGTQAVAAEPATPYVAADGRTLVLDGTTLTDDIYLENPALLRSFALKFVQGPVTVRVQVGSATYDVGTGLVRLTAEGSGMPLANVMPGATFSLHPRFFRVSTDGAFDALPASSTIKIEFQATSANSMGAPDEVAVTAWTSNVGTLNTNPNNTSFRFFRFRVAFDIAADGSPLSATTPIPSLDFMRLPFRF